MKVPQAMSPYVAWNLFDFPAGILPISMVTQEDEDRFFADFPTNDLVNSAIKPFEIDNIDELHILGKTFKMHALIEYKHFASLNQNRFINITKVGAGTP